jgi:hypothetical protein
MEGKDLSTRKPRTFSLEQLLELSEYCRWLGLDSEEILALIFENHLERKKE